MTFSEIVKLHRERLVLNKKQLAERVGVTQPYIVQIENDGKVPGDSVVLKLADALELDRRELLFAAYRARASEDTRHYFHSLFDDLTPTEEFNQPFIESRKDQFESPDFSLRHLGTAHDGSFQVALIRAKIPGARFSTHAHKVPQVYVAVEGTFELTIGDEVVSLSPESTISTMIPALAPHDLRAVNPGRVLTVTLGQVVRTQASPVPAGQSTSRERLEDLG